MEAEWPRRRVGVFTGTRAEYGLLRPLLRQLHARADADTVLMVSGAHLAPSHGLTWQEVERDGFQIHERIEILLDGDTDSSVCTAAGLGLMRYGEALRRLNPDLLVLLGDRYEALAAATAATVCRIPIAHIHGGEQTNGAIDNAFRHAITKMSHLHFTSTALSRDRVIQMGEDPVRVFDVGALGVENTREIPLLPASEVRARLGLPPEQGYFLVTFHPATLEALPPIEQIDALLNALHDFPEYAVIFTGANADAGGRSINERISTVAQSSAPRMKVFASLGAELYLSAANYAEVVVGNSSSGIIEIPSLGVPVVDIGTRQAGRERADSVFWSRVDGDEIRSCLKRALTAQCRSQAKAARNPYEKARTSETIADILLGTSLDGVLHKPFVDHRA